MQPDAIHRRSRALANRAHELYQASRIVEDRRKHARHVTGRLVEAVTGRDLQITLEVPGDLRDSPYVGTLLATRMAGQQLRFRSTASSLYYDVNILRQVCQDYFRHPDCVPRVGELVIDAGANVGGYSMIAALLEPTVSVHAFEPFSRAYSKLAANCRINGLDGRVVTSRVALGAKPDQLELLSTEEGRQGTLVSALTSNDSPGEMVSVAALDQYIVDHGLSAPAIIKLDVEGFEIEVLRGGHSALTAARLLVVEWHSLDLLQHLTQLADQAGLELVTSCSDDLTHQVGIAYFRRPAG